MVFCNILSYTFIIILDYINYRNIDNCENVIAQSSHSCFHCAELKVIFSSLLQAKMVLKHLRPGSIISSENMADMFPLLVEKLKQMEKLPALFFL